MATSHLYGDVPQLEDVALKLGWLVIYCTELEWVAFQAIRQFEPDKRAARELSQQEFKRRISAVIQVTKHNCQPSENLNEWLRLWERICSFADERNAALHNPMMVNIYEDELGNFEMKRELHTFRNPTSRFDGNGVDAIQKAVEKASHYCNDAFRLLVTLTPLS